MLSSFIFLTFLSLQLYHGATVHDITPSRPLFPNGSLISSNQIFELGFFRPNISSNNQYVGIWFKDTSPAKVIWLASRNTPLPYSDQSATLTLGRDGNLKLLSGQKSIIWTTNVSASTSSGSLSAILLDSGNFVLKEVNSGSSSSLWESFSNPSDTLVQTMKMEINNFTGNKQYLTCWKSQVDPSDGNFVTGITSDIPPQIYIWINGSIPHWRSGQWDQAKFNGIETMIESYTSVFAVQQDIQQGTTYFVIKSYNSYEFRFIYLSSNGMLHLMYRNNSRAKEWTVEWEGPTNPCEVYGTCGSFGVCNILSSPICSCLQGFEPNSSEEWRRGNWKGGCTRVMQLNCQKNNTTMVTSLEMKQDVFLKKSLLKLPDSPVFLGILGDVQQCSTWCLNNCSCLAYTYVKTIGCMTWTNELMDIQQFSFRGEDLFLRLAEINNGGNSRRWRELVISLTIISIVIGLGAALWALYSRRAIRKKSSTKIEKLRDLRVADGSTKGISSLKEKLKGEDGQVLSVFYFDSILTATDNFSNENKLGQGGFGSVYKGKLQDGKIVAVKRLSSNSGQGMKEFKTEILLISKLQHRNLVRLIGCCIEEEEKILIYEYLPNKSLDTFLFNPTNKTKLTWDTRFQIVQGIARGILYLHRDSHLRVIHRDLKASNVLLDEKLNPKISDFGLARIFEGTQELVNTQRVVGTLGYMAPEYAMGGIFSEKSDIYSFGILMLEIISNMKNTSFYDNEEHANLLSYAWKLWKEGRSHELLEKEVVESSSSEEVEKCIQVGLMCVQNNATERPHISCVIQMLNGELNLSEPKQPSFSFQINSTDGDGAPFRQENLCSNVAATVSTVEGR